MGSDIGYVRVSSVGQNEARQLEGLEVDKIFIDKASGGSTERPALTDLLAWVREGDVMRDRTACVRFAKLPMCSPQKSL